MATVQSKLQMSLALVFALGVSPLDALEPVKPLPPKKADAPVARGLGEIGALQAISIDAISLGEKEAKPVLRGPDSRFQLIVSARHASGIETDVTRVANYSAEPEGIVLIDESGLVTPVAEGSAKVTARLESLEGGADQIATTEFSVEKLEKPDPINFPNQVVPIFTKHGCNGGGCHGKSGGQNGFRLSLLGFYPEEDYEFLKKEGRGRRISIAAPDRSLLLLKGTNVVPHGGGARMVVDSHEYNTVYRWMQQGMPYGSKDDPVIERIAVFPRVRRMDLESRQQLRVVAYYSNGTSEDVTRTATYESNDTEMAEVTDGGLVSTLGLAGEVAVMIRYHGLVDVFRSVIPMGFDVKELPKPRNLVDALVFKKWQDLGIPPSAVADDATYLRRVTIDIAGRLPTFAEVKAFQDDKAPNKRDRLVDRLLESPDYAEYFANKWSAILRNRRVNGNYTRGTYAFYDWLRSSLHQNRPYDKMVRDIIAASGEVTYNPPVAWYRAVNSTEQQVEDSAQLFLGLRIQCARCHHHPFEVWSQKDYYGYSAFFSRIGKKNNREGRADEQRIFHNPGQASAKNPRGGQTLKPTGLGGQPLNIAADRDPRQILADWMANPKNPFFAPALVNRY
ncbi:MAG: DUF1549 domain-containing protein, partial [Planctomycetota bacterium]